MGPSSAALCVAVVLVLLVLSWLEIRLRSLSAFFMLALLFSEEASKMSMKALLFSFLFCSVVYFLNSMELFRAVLHNG